MTESLGPPEITFLLAVRRLLLSTAAFIQKYLDTQTISTSQDRSLLLIGQQGQKIKFDYDPGQGTLSLQNNDQPPEHLSPPDIQDLYRYIKRVYNSSST